MKSYTLSYSERFSEGLAALITEWEAYFDFPEEKIRLFVSTIQKSLELCKFNPEMYQDVTDIYGFDKPTRRILIGKQYAIFYRVDEEKALIQVGLIASQSQMKINF